MEFLSYFEPIQIDELKIPKSKKSFIYNNIIANSENQKTGDIYKNEIAIIGIPESRNAMINGTELAPNEIRSQLYNLFCWSSIPKIVDMGNIIRGNSIEDTYAAMRDIGADLIQKGVLPVFVGGSQDLCYGNYLAYQKLEKVISLVTVDAKLDIGENETDFNSDTYISKIILENSTSLFSLANVAYQSYLVSNEDLILMNKLLFDAHRLGVVRKEMMKMEPVFREADMVSFDINAVRQSDAPGQANPSPNGLYSEEACQLARYAGMSDKLTSFGIYNCIPEMDINYQTSALCAQIIWHFIDGYSKRKKEYPFIGLEKYKKFIVSLNNLENDIVFYKSFKSDRWWMEIPLKKDKFNNNIIIACSYEDYVKACSQEVPDKWWKTFQKFN